MASCACGRSAFATTRAVSTRRWCVSCSAITPARCTWRMAPPRRPCPGPTPVGATTDAHADTAANARGRGRARRTASGATAREAREEVDQAALAVLGQLCLGRVQLTLSVSGFVKRWQKTGENFEEVPLSMPHHTYCTRACWIDLPESSGAELARSGLEIDVGLHALAHAVLAVLPLRLSCEAGDLGCVSATSCASARSGRSGCSSMTVRRAASASVIARTPSSSLVASDALKLMKECPCVEGCYCCCHSSRCLEYNACNDKRAGIAVAELLIAAAARPASLDAKAAAAKAARAAGRRGRRERRAPDGGGGGQVAGELQREQADGDDLKPSMLGASIRRL